jgi:hypothetical protein
MKRWVAIQGGRVVAEGRDSEKLTRKMLEKSSTAFFIGRIGVPPELIELPGFEIAE